MMIDAYFSWFQMNVNNMLKHRDLKFEPLMSFVFYKYFW